MRQVFASNAVAEWQSSDVNFAGTSNSDYPWWTVDLKLNLILVNWSSKLAKAWMWQVVKWILWLCLKRCTIPVLPERVFWSKENELLCTNQFTNIKSQYYYMNTSRKYCKLWIKKISGSVKLYINNPWGKPACLWNGSHFSIFFIMADANILFLLAVVKPETKTLEGLVIWNFSVWHIFTKWQPFFDSFTMADAIILCYRNQTPVTVVESLFTWPNNIHRMHEHEKCYLWVVVQQFINKDVHQLGVI